MSLKRKIRKAVPRKSAGGLPPPRLFASPLTRSRETLIQHLHAIGLQGGSNDHPTVARYNKRQTKKQLQEIEKDKLRTKYEQLSQQSVTDTTASPQLTKPCPICNKPYKLHEIYVTLPCSHCYHKTCTGTCIEELCDECIRCHAKI